MTNDPNVPIVGQESRSEYERRKAHEAEIGYWLGAISFAVNNKPQLIKFMPLTALTNRGHVRRAKDTHRVNGKGYVGRPPGTVTLTLPDEAIVSIVDDKERDAWVVVRIHRDLMEQYESPIVRPGEGKE